MKGLSLVRTGDAFALAIYTAATLDEVADFLATDRLMTLDIAASRRTARRPWAVLKAERALIAELEEQKRNLRAGGIDHETIEAKLAEIRRRIAEIEDTTRAQVAIVGAGRSRP